MKPAQATRPARTKDRARKPRNGYHAGLSRAAVVAAAVDLLQREGLGGFSVRRLAADLGVDTMTIYKHVRNKDDLLGAAVRSAFENVRPAGQGEWWEQVATAFREQRRAIRAQPWVLAVMLSFSLEAGEPWESVDQILALLEAHLGRAGAARWVRLLSAFTNGFLLSETDLVQGPDTSQVAAAYPRVMAAAARNARTGNRDFEVGLELLVSAMRAEATA